MQCANCGTELHPQARLCWKCGESLIEEGGPVEAYRSLTPSEVVLWNVLSFVNPVKSGDLFVLHDNPQARRVRAQVRTTEVELAMLRAALLGCRRTGILDLKLIPLSRYQTRNPDKIGVQVTNLGRDHEWNNLGALESRILYDSRRDRDGCMLEDVVCRISLDSDLGKDALKWRGLVSTNEDGYFSSVEYPPEDVLAMFEECMARQADLWRAIEFDYEMGVSRKPRDDSFL